ncbi:MAG: glycosyltransferase family 87 protein [Hyphomicrobiales bacterium]
MSAQGIATPAAPQMSAARLIGLIGLMLALGYLVVLGGAWVQGHWLIDAQGRAIANDFVNVWAAGQLALDGNAAAAYDWTAHKAAEVRAVGHAFENYFGWHYPPTFLFAAVSLAMLPYTAAALVWLGVTLPGYLAAMRAIIGQRAGILLALGCPAVLWNATAGQNGFLTASLVGGTLACLERHPTWAGIFLGLLTYKPHFGLLFPVALIAGARWRVIIVAAGVAIAMALLSWMTFGSAPWQAFFDGLSVTSQAVLGEGRADLHRLQSVFGFVRAHGGSETLAWTLQASVAGALALAIFALWRSRAPFELKAAALSCAALLATPYLYIYDLVVLAIPAAFLIRFALVRGFFISEAIGLSAAAALLLIYPYVKTHTGLAATLIVAMLIIQRVLSSARNDIAR